MIGFAVKVYRNHEKCSRALDRKNSIPPNTCFILAASEVGPIIRYLQLRGARKMHIVVDGEPTGSLECPEECSLIISRAWDNVLDAVRKIGAQVIPPGTAHVPNKTKPTTTTTQARSSPTNADAQASTADKPATLIWVSDQAFKPAAAAQKEELEALGCQVKCYKTHKNAARALDKKRSLVRTCILVNSTEANLLIAYLNERPELQNTKVVVEANSQSAVRAGESSTCKVAVGWSAAVAAAHEVLSDPTFM